MSDHPNDLPGQHRLSAFKVDPTIFDLTVLPRGAAKDQETSIASFAQTKQKDILRIFDWQETFDLRTPVVRELAALSSHLKHFQTVFETDKAGYELLKINWAITVPVFKPEKFKGTPFESYVPSATEIEELARYCLVFAFLPLRDLQMKGSPYILPTKDKEDLTRYLTRTGVSTITVLNYLWLVQRAYLLPHLRRAHPSKPEKPLVEELLLKGVSNVGDRALYAWVFWFIAIREITFDIRRRYFPNGNTRPNLSGKLSKGKAYNDELSKKIYEEIKSRVSWWTPEYMTDTSTLAFVDFKEYLLGHTQRQRFE